MAAPRLQRTEPDRSTDAFSRRLYADLRRLAHRRLARESGPRTLQATALVHEAYLRLLEESDRSWSHPGQFYSAAATAMRRILVDQARARHSLKRGDAHGRVPLESVEAAAEEQDLGLVDHALAKLETFDPRMAKIVELRYFVGLDAEETAAVMGLSTRTVRREWSAARVWLARNMDAWR